MSGPEALGVALRESMEWVTVDAIVTKQHAEQLSSELTAALPDILARHGYYLAPISGPTSPGVRNTDPRTSAVAAYKAKMRAGSQRHLLLNSYAIDTLGITDEEAMEYAVGVNPLSEYASRCAELRSAGFIEDTGEDRKGGSGTPRIVCRITDKGRAELSRLA